MSSSGDSFSFGSSSPQIGLTGRPGSSQTHTVSDGLTSLLQSLQDHNRRSSDDVMDGVSRLKTLYPFTDMSDLPQAWSCQDRSNWISLSDCNLKAHYKGSGKGHKDAAAVRATHSIPQSCLLYYFEMKIISKGRDGYMGMGLAAIDVNMSRLPGWDKNSYGYHGDDGHSFCSSGTGVPYGPTFTTGDIIGCGYNLVENNCFYTKNGMNLGIAFSNLPCIPLFPTVGLQTPGEEVEANFGMKPFIYDIEDDIKGLRKRITECIINFPVPFTQMQSSMNSLVQSWLVHNGYCSTAQVFANATNQPFTQNVLQIKQRLRIQKFVLSGRIHEAIRLTDKLYPEVLRENPNLRFALKCRQFIEMIDASNQVKEGQQHVPVKQSLENNSKAVNNSRLIIPHNEDSSNSSNGVTPALRQSKQPTTRSTTRQMRQDLLNDCNGNSNGVDDQVDEHVSNNNRQEQSEDLINMETDYQDIIGSNNHDEDDDIEDGLVIEEAKPVSMEDILSFGRDLRLQARELSRIFGENESNRKMLDDAFALMAYPNPKDSEVGWLLNSSEREVVCQQLNNAIVLSQMTAENMNSPSRQPALETLIKQCKTLLKLNGQTGAWILDSL